MRIKSKAVKTRSIKLSLLICFGLCLVAVFPTLLVVFSPYAELKLNWALVVSVASLVIILVATFAYLRGINLELTSATTDRKIGKKLEPVGRFLNILSWLVIVICVICGFFYLFLVR